MTSNRDPAEAPLVVGLVEAARLLGLSERKAQYLVSSGEIPSFKVGRRRLIARTEITAYIARQCAA